MTQLSKAISEKLKACENYHPHCIAPVSVTFFREMASRLLAVEGQDPVGYYRKGSDGFYFASPTEQRPGTIPLYAAPQPVAVQRPVRYLNKFTGVCVTLEQQPDAATDTAVYVPLFDAPQPAPVAQPVQVPPEKWVNPDIHYADENGFAEGWNACRAAMLKGGKS